MKNQSGNRKFKQFIFNWYPWILIGLIALSIWWFSRSPRSREDLNLLLVIFGGLISFFYFVLKQQSEEIELFTRLYQDFNQRYDKLNEDLNRIYSQDSDNELSGPDTYILFDYFNLCSEEYLYFTRGYIFPEVWKAWCNGIYFYLKNKKIGDLWADEEKNAASYYGLTLEEIESHVITK